jgi:phenylacetate-CoA ligase
LNKYLEHIYPYLPVALQNVFTSAYGFLLNRWRYGGNSKDYVAELMSSQFFSTDELIRLQEEKLSGLINIAYHNVPYYRDLFDGLKLKPSDIKEIDDLAKLPVLTKDDIKAYPEKFINRNLEPKSLLTRNTSGTSGKPLKIYCDKESLRHNYAFFLRTRSWRGIELGDRRATFGGRIIVPQNQLNPPFWRYDINENNLLFSSYHMSEINLQHYYSKISRFNPVEIRGYPSSLYFLAAYMRRNNLPALNPKGVFTTAETLLEYQRDVIEKAFGCPVSDQYGSTEMVNFITQCNSGTYHIHPEYSIIEVLKEGKAVDVGEPGEVVCTSFINYAMPLIRYKLGDTLKLSAKKCKCGLCFPVVEQIIGRTDDILFTPEGIPVGRLDPVFKGLNGIKETQIIQTQKNKLMVKIKKDEQFLAEDNDKLIQALRKRLGRAMQIELIFVDEIPKDKNGKFRAVISMIEDKGIAKQALP